MAHCTDLREHSRRDFLRQLGLLGAGTLVLGQSHVHALVAAPALSDAPTDRVLVLLRLKGGNDGLNTILPLHDYATYRAARPEVHLKETEGTKLGRDLVVHPQMARLRGLWEEGAMRIVRGVGYPEQNLSHFRSADIWATTSEADVVVSSGVLGRYLEGVYPAFLSAPPATPPAIQIGGVGNLLFNNSDNFNYAVSTRDPAQLYEVAKTGRLYGLDALPDGTYGDQLGYLRAVANTTFRYAAVLAEAYRAGSNAAEYRDDTLGEQLSLVARLLRGGLGTKLFVVELDGFDTHAKQLEEHAYLLRSVSENVAAFYADLGTAGQGERVLTMTFSEFGRRVAQNASLGTDHGAAAPLLLFGPALEGSGTVGAPPDLQDLDPTGNLKYDTDFRSVYATVLEQWLCIEAAAVDELLGSSPVRLGNLGFTCGDTTVATERPADPAATIGLSAYLSGDAVTVEYSLAGPAEVRLHFYNVGGQRLSTPFRGVQQAGPQQHRFGLIAANLSAGIYLVSVETGGRVYTRRIALFRP